MLSCKDLLQVNVAPVIFGIAGTLLTDEEIKLFKEVRPWGFVLFKRNIENRQQVIDLCNSLKAINADYEAQICIDQEGGRVARLQPPLVSALYPSMKSIIEFAFAKGREAENVIFESFESLGEELKEYGITIDFAPVADLLFEGADTVIGDRSFGSDPEFVAKACVAASQALIKAGIIPTLKHIPGHGRAKVDSHHALPLVESSLEELERTDFLAFEYIAKDLGESWQLAMTAHIVYSCLDEKYPATLSKTVISYIRNEIGFNGLLITDDLSMNALNAFGSLADNAVNALAAGCDIVLHCNGNLDEMKSISEALNRWCHC